MLLVWLWSWNPLRPGVRKSNPTESHWTIRPKMRTSSIWEEFFFDRTVCQETSAMEILTFYKPYTGHVNSRPNMYCKFASTIPSHLGAHFLYKITFYWLFCVLYMCSSFWLLGVKLRDFSQAPTIFTQNNDLGPFWEKIVVILWICASVQAALSARRHFQTRTKSCCETLPP